jgi:hypothetical protein
MGTRCRLGQRREMLKCISRISKLDGRGEARTQRQQAKGWRTCAASHGIECIELNKNGRWKRGFSGCMGVCKRQEMSRLVVFRGRGQRAYNK